ncbi:hypothetical protein ACV3R1_08290 [Clostridium perfringens]|uniref:hypothetical protein n=2 Tax=Clostridium perfringens TaxID=1502 RepID=UPI001A202B28|nr:hypothetical protein [Clostridium perfringens]EGT2192056.1 hypothetical protein [Clostridium perfringens]EHA0993019.1 hypothetical protein [Clostridium perfringens]EHA1183689.1 hypothetical protein [Clostridium perfringens]MDK0841745.1 hypothetical protein [Clostridium perfringens]MDM0901644.1 hypothetical protein [Clostridium perfringens]
MDNYGFCDIESFNFVFKERFREYKFIKECSKNGECKILLMHLGGIIVECYIKSRITQKMNITKSRNNKALWYSNDKFEYLVGINNCKKSILNSEFTIKNPKHNIEEAIKCISELNNVLTDRPDMLEHIKRIQKPFNDNREFIDLRYSISEKSEEFDRIFNLWENSFKQLIKWINEIL